MGAEAGPRAPLRLLYVATLAYFTVNGMFLSGLQLFVVGPLEAAESMVGLAVGAFAISAIGLRPFFGRAMDRRGRRPFLLGSLVLLAVACLGFTVAASVAAVVALRVLQGAAGAAFYTTSAALVIDLTPPERRATGIARFSLFLYGGLAVGPSLAEAVIRGWGFDAAWLLATGLAVVGLLCVLPFAEPVVERVGERTATRTRLLHPGALAPGLVLLMPSVGYAAVVGFSTLYADAVGLAWGGLLYASFATTVILARLLAGNVADRFGHKRVTFPGLAAAALGLALLAGLRLPASAVAGVVLFGLGFAFVFPALMALTMDRISDRERGEGVATFTAFMDVGLGGGGFVIGVLVETSGFTAAFSLAAALCALGGVVLALVRPRAPVTR